MSAFRKTSPSAEAAKEKWKIGTLTYTSTGIVALFILLLFGDFAWAMRDRSIMPAANWYLKSLGVSNVLFGLLISSFPALLTLIVSPIVSTRSDRHRGKRGRRLPFLLVTTPIAALGIIGIGLTPVLSTFIHNTFPDMDERSAAIAAFAFFWAIFEIAAISGQAVFGGLINDVVPKPLLGRFYGLFRVISLLDGIIFNYWIIGHIPTHFTVILVAIGLFYGCAFLWVCFRVKEGSYPPPPPVEPGDGPVVGVKRYCRECFSNSYYLLVFSMLTLGMLSLLPVNAFAIPYAKSVGMSMELYGKCLAASFTTSLFLSFFIGWAVDRFHPIRVTLTAQILYLMTAILGAIYATDVKTFAAAFVAHSIISGFYLTSVASLGLQLYPQQKFGQFSSAAGVILALSTIGLSPLVGFIIDISGGEFRYTFAAGVCLSVPGIFAAFVTYKRFRQMGGFRGYVAPES
ncbi:MAG: MFS transporter [Chthoniobacterales bacterium]